MLHAFLGLSFICLVDTSMLEDGNESSLHSAKQLRTSSRQATEMLVPRSSTTALMCEPVFTGVSGTARWFRNGVPVANVTSTSNAVLFGRSYHSEQPVPDVGFLIITNVTSGDEGEYWCRRDDTAQEGEAVKIVLAFVDRFPPHCRPLFSPPSPSLGERLTARCPRTDAVPPPSTSWTLNGEPVDLSSGRIQISTNGTLAIQRFLPQDVGLYECVVSNFAGRTTAKAFVYARRNNDGKIQEMFDTTIFASACHSIFKNGLLWFLIGSLATSCVVLVYLLCAMLFLRPGSRNRITLRPALFLRSHPGLGPGFRKVISPTPDIYRARCGISRNNQHIV